MPTELEEYMRQGWILIAIGSLTPLLVSSAVGLLVSILQAATQVQESSTQYLSKFLAVALVVLLLGGVAGQALTEFFIQGVALFSR